jgi:hypothetical protein
LIKDAHIPAQEEVAGRGCDAGRGCGASCGGEGRRGRARWFDIADCGKRSSVVRTTEEAVVRLRSLAVFGLGYVLGTRAGRERYEQIVAAAQNASKRLESYRGKLESVSGKIDSLSSGLDEFKVRLRDYSGNRPAPNQPVRHGSSERED